AFGLDSAVIERHTGRRVVNMGLYAGLGVPFMLDEARAGARRGDVVVIALEHFFYGMDEDTICEPMDWLTLFRLNPLAVRPAPPRACRGLFRRCGDGLVPFAAVLHDALSRQQLEYIYARNQFNEAGDQAQFRERTPDLPPLEAYQVPRNPEICARTAALI